jgi:hypothetical protein
MKRTIIFVVPIAAMLMLVATALAQSGGSYTLEWFSVDGGGGTSSGGAFVLHGIAGQPDAGASSGSSFAITGGYLAVSLTSGQTTTSTATVTSSPTFTATHTKTATRTFTPSSTATKTSTNPSGATNTPTRTPTKTPTQPGNTNTPTRTRTATPTLTNGAPTNTHTPTTTPTDECLTKPTKVTLKAPAKDASLTTARPTLKWSAATCVLTYTVTVKNAATNKNVFKANNLTGLKVKTDALPKGKSYKWFVQSCNNIGCTKSATWNFTVN